MLAEFATLTGLIFVAKENVLDTGALERIESLTGRLGTFVVRADANVCADVEIPVSELELMTLVVITVGRLAEIVDVLVGLFAFGIIEEVVIDFGVVFPNNKGASGVLIGVVKILLVGVTSLLAVVVAKEIDVKPVLVEPKVGTEETGFWESETEENINCV